MLRYFNSGYFTRTLMLVFLAAFMWLPAFLMLEETIVAEYQGPLYQLFILVTGNNTYLHLSIAFFLTIVAALLLNQIATQYGFTEKISHLGMLVYILFSSALVSQTAMNPVIFINFLMLFFLQSLFKLTESKAYILHVFNASFILGIASLFYPSAINLFLLIWIALLVFTVGQWRNFVVSLIGFVLPLLFAFTWYFWFDQLPEAYSLFLSSFTIHFPEVVPEWPIDWTVGIALLFFILVSALKTNSNLMEKNINIRQMLTVSLNYLAFSFVLVLLFATNSAYILLLAIPASLIVASTLTGIRKAKWYEWSLWFITLFILFNHYSYLLYAA